MVISERNHLAYLTFLREKILLTGSQTDEKGLPAGGTDKRGAHVSSCTVQTKKVEEETEF